MSHKLNMQEGGEAPPIRQPEDSATSVVFRGDGEPKTPRDTLRKLSEFDSEAGLERDYFSLGGTVKRLEKRFAEMLGKDASIFMPTGTLANHLAIRKHCGLKRRAVVQEQSHLYHDTGDCVAQLSGINLIPLAKNRPYFTLDELKVTLNVFETGRVATQIGAVLIESPVRRQAGRVVPFEEMENITGFSRDKGISTHLDGARLYMMSAATGVKPRKYTKLFDTVYVSLYKYFGAPFGAILAGTSEFIDGLYHLRRMFGGGLREAYVAAAPALKGSEDFEERFSTAMAKAKELFTNINRLSGIDIGRYEHGSNIFPVELDANINTEKFIATLYKHWVFVYLEDGSPWHTHLTVNTTLLRRSNDDILTAFEDALTQSRR